MQPNRLGDYKCSSLGRRLPEHSNQLYAKQYSISIELVS